ncbi:MAG: 50S ribosomal protein L18 [Nanoarchaeota archaeon]
MVSRKPKTVYYRRRREGKTDYQRRLKLLLSSKKRLVVRFTNSKIIAQVISFAQKGDKIIAATDSAMLRKLGWPYSCKNIPSAYLLGLAIGKKALDKSCKEAILDTGMRNPLHKGKVYAFLKGVLDSGMDVPCGDETVFPEKNRLEGAHVQEYALNIKKGKEEYSRQFAQYLKTNAEPEKMVQQFNEIKKRIIGK